MTQALRERLGEERALPSDPQSASEDASVIGREWGVHLTLEPGLEAMLAAAGAGLVAPGAE